MTTIYRIGANELSVAFIESVKKKFADKTITIMVTDAGDETDYLLATDANKQSLEKSLKEIEEGEITSMTLHEFQAKYGKN